MKIKLSKSQWKVIGHKCGWLNKKSQIDPEQLSQIRQKNKEKLDQYGIANEFTHFWDSQFTPSGTISEIHKNQFGTYVLLTDGTIEIKDDTLEDYIDNTEQAIKVWERKDSDPTDTFCKDCGLISPKVDNIDLGIGKYEFQGAPGTDKRIVPVTTCCNSDVEDKYGRKQDTEPNVPTKENFEEDRREDMRKEKEDILREMGQ